MLGVKTVDPRKFAVTEEASKQYDVVVEEIQKWSDMTQRGWYLISQESFTKLCNDNFRNGIITGVAITGTVAIIHKFVTKHKTEEE